MTFADSQSIYIDPVCSSTPIATFYCLEKQIVPNCNANMPADKTDRYNRTWIFWPLIIISESIVLL